MATHSSGLALEKLHEQSLAGYSPWGSQRVRHDRATKHSTAQHNTVGRPLRTTFEGLLGDKNDKTEHQTEKIYCDTSLLTENELSVKDFKTMLYTRITNRNVHVVQLKI